MVLSNTILIIFSILSALYAISYGNYEAKNSNKTSAIVIYTIALAGIALSIFKIFI